MNSERQRIGIIGLGLLGTAISQRFRGEGFEVVGYDLDPAAGNRLLAEGGVPKSSPGEVFAVTTTIILALPNSDVVAQLLDDVADSLRSSQTIIDTTTGDPDQMTRFAQVLTKRGVHYLEANVAGASTQLANGEAVLLVGGEQESIDACKEILIVLSPRQFYVGDTGCGARFKLVHNLILGLHRAVLAEGLAFAESLGFDLKMTLDVLRQTPAASQVMETKGKKMIEREYSPQAKLAQHLKDVRLILSMASRMGAQTPLSQIHSELLQQAESLGLGNLDNSSIREIFGQAAEEAQP